MKCRKAQGSPIFRVWFLMGRGVDTVMNQGGCFLSLVVFVVLQRKDGLWPLDLNQIPNDRSPGSLDLASQ